MEEASKQLNDFIAQLVRLNATMAELFRSGNVALFTEMNAAIKEMYRLQHGSTDRVLKTLDPECVPIYRNFDMIVEVLRTTEDGEIDKGAQGALNKFLHNIDESVVNIAVALGIVSK